MIWQRFLFHDFHNLSQYASMFVIVMLQPAVREERGKKIPKYHAKGELPCLRHMENCALCKHPSIQLAGQGAVERSQVFCMMLSPLALQIFFNILVNIFSPKRSEENGRSATQDWLRNVCHVYNKTFSEALVLISAFKVWGENNTETADSNRSHLGNGAKGNF